MANPSQHSKSKPSRYTVDRQMPGAYEGETVTRRRLFEGGALAAGGIASAAFGLPALGFALGPVFEDTTPTRYRDVGPERDFSADNYTPKVMSIVENAGEAGKTTVYVRRFNPELDGSGPADTREATPYIVITTRCSHLGCPVRFVQASKRFICPCHGGVYDFEGKVAAGPPVRPLDRFYTKVERGRVLVGDRFSVNSQLERFPHYRDPAQHIEGLWKYVYPGRPTT